MLGVVLRPRERGRLGCGVGAVCASPCDHGRCVALRCAARAAVFEGLTEDPACELDTLVSVAVRDGGYFSVVDGRSAVIHAGLPWVVGDGLACLGQKTPRTADGAHGSSADRCRRRQCSEFGCPRLSAGVCRGSCGGRPFCQRHLGDCPACLRGPFCPECRPQVAHTCMPERPPPAYSDCGSRCPEPGQQSRGTLFVKSSCCKGAGMASCLAGAGIKFCQLSPGARAPSPARITCYL